LRFCAAARFETKNPPREGNLSIEFVIEE